MNELFEIIEVADKEIRGVIDDIFKKPGISDKIFGECSTYSIVNGAPLWVGFIVTLVSECDEIMLTQNKAENPKLRKLLKKYKK